MVTSSVFSASASALLPAGLTGRDTSSPVQTFTPGSSLRRLVGLFLLSSVLFASTSGVTALFASVPKYVGRSRPFELLTRRMDVDVDGAPNAYGPRGSKALDSLKHAHYRGWKNAEIVGYLTEDRNPHVPVLQGPHDPYPGLYISQTAFTDPARTREADTSRYVDATRINYIVLGSQAHSQGARLGDFVAVYSRSTHRSAYGILGDSGNPSGDEGSLHLLQALGYPFHDGRHDAVERPEIVIRYFPHSNPHALFFRSQAALDQAAMQRRLSRDFSGSRLAQTGHPRSY